jgi:hypothetical protein
MCRVVYEAQRSLSDWEFEGFCEEIGLTKPSAIRKFIAVGQAYPGIIQYNEAFRSAAVVARRKCRAFFLDVSKRGATLLPS